MTLVGSGVGNVPRGHLLCSTEAVWLLAQELGLGSISNAGRVV